MRVHIYISDNGGNSTPRVLQRDSRPASKRAKCHNLSINWSFLILKLAMKYSQQPISVHLFYFISDKKSRPGGL